MGVVVLSDKNGSSQVCEAVKTGRTDGREETKVVAIDRKPRMGVRFASLQRKRPVIQARVKKLFLGCVMDGGKRRELLKKVAKNSQE